MSTVVHVTHEAIQKVGGIGAVLQGFFTAKTYNEGVKRSILVGPLGGPEDEALLAKNGKVLYSGVSGADDGGWAARFRPVQERYGVRIVYGRRTFRDRATGVESSPEVVLVDVSAPNLDRLGEAKRMLFERFGIKSDLYREGEYEQYVRLAGPGLAALDALGAASDGPGIILAHEFMGMPLALE